MAVSGGPNIVEDGLVLALDAANVKSYPKTGTVWSDLSENNNTGTLTNSPAFNSTKQGIIIFDGLDDFIDVANPTRFDFTNTTFTVTLWFNTSLTTTGFIVAKGGNTGGWYVAVNAAGVVSVGQKDGETGVVTTFRISNSTVNDGKWHHAAVVITTSTTVAGNNSQTIYVDGQLNQGNLTNTGVYGTEAGSMYIGKRSNGNNYTGQLGSVQIYNRGMTAVEVLQNFNATRSRFGV